MTDPPTETPTDTPAPSPGLNIEEIFGKGQEGYASDIHLVVRKPPMARYFGSLETIEGYEEPLSPEQIEKLIDSLLKETQRERFRKEREIDLSYQDCRGVRYRINCHYERDNMGLVARIIPDQIPSMDDVQLPEITKELINYERGIILCTGPTGSGKSTTLAAMIQEINKTRPLHVITLEDPIEFLYKSDNCLVRQRQFGTDFLSFGEALKRILRQDPDVILVGEMRDLETIAAALTLAETGHLVFATLHTSSAAQTIDRIIDVFPPHQQSQIRTQLSTSLQAVVSQQLVARKGGGRCALREVMINTPAVGNIIRDNRIAELPNVIQTCGEEGMITFERDAARLYQKGVLDKDTALQFVVDPGMLKTLKVDKKGGFFG